MAREDVYEFAWATQYDGATAINTLYFRQNLDVVGQEEIQLRDDFFGLLNGPWDKLRLQYHQDAEIVCSAVQRVAEVPAERYDFGETDRNGLKDGAGLPSHNAPQLSWYAMDEFGEEVTNRLFFCGFDVDILEDHHYTQDFLDWAEDFAKTIENFGTIDSPTSDTWYLQHRTNTGGNLLNIFYGDAETPFLRPWISRMTNRRPARCS